MQEYKAAARNLLASLRRNGGLRERCLQHTLLPRDLVRLELAELATPEQREKDQAIQVRVYCCAVCDTLSSTSCAAPGD